MIHAQERQYSMAESVWMKYKICHYNMHITADFRDDIAQMFVTKRGGSLPL